MHEKLRILQRARNEFILEFEAIKKPADLEGYEFQYENTKHKVLKAYAGVAAEGYTSYLVITQMLE